MALEIAWDGNIDSVWCDVTDVPTAISHVNCFMLMFFFHWEMFLSYIFTNRRQSGYQQQIKILVAICSPKPNLYTTYKVTSNIYLQVIPLHLYTWNRQITLIKRMVRSVIDLYVPTDTSYILLKTLSFSRRILWFDLFYHEENSKLPCIQLLLFFLIFYKKLFISYF